MCVWPDRMADNYHVTCPTATVADDDDEEDNNDGEYLFRSVRKTTDNCHKQ